MLYDNYTLEKEKIEEGHDLIFDELNLYINKWPWKIYLPSGKLFNKKGFFCRKQLIKDFYEEKPFYKNKTLLFELLTILCERYDLKLHFYPYNIGNNNLYYESIFLHNNIEIYKSIHWKYHDSLFGLIYAFLKNK